jgi:hypothetical protein
VHAERKPSFSGLLKHNPLTIKPASAGARTRGDHGVTKIRRAIGYLANWRGAAGLAAAVLLTGAGAASAAAGAGADSAGRAAAAPGCPGWVAVRPPDPGAQLNTLFGVAVLAKGNVWAVGDYTNAAGLFQTLTEHWNGRTWSRVPSPDPGIGSNYLTSVSAVSATSIWAVGGYSDQSGGITADKTLVLHWNGHKWDRVASPSPGGFADDLSTVRKVSAANVWAVGLYAGGDSRDRSLILHWNGRVWARVPSPDPGKQSDSLDGLAVVSARSIWTTELYSNSAGMSGTSLILHWNGRSWSKAAAGPGGSELIDVSASSASNAWAVGDDARGLSMALHWNGRAWSRVKTPNLKPGQLTSALRAVTVVSPSSAWAVGDAQDLSTFDSTAIEMHWNGRAWSMMTSPAPGGTSALFAVQATPAASPWAAGEYGLSSQVQRTLAFRCR